VLGCWLVAVRELEINIMHAPVKKFLVEGAELGTGEIVRLMRGEGGIIISLARALYRRNVVGTQQLCASSD
jgi:hypothetical protein